MKPSIEMIDAAMVEMANIHPPLKRSECSRLIGAALDAHVHAIDTSLERVEKSTENVHEPVKLWLWKNFVDGKPEYWAFDNAFPVHMDHGDPQTIGEPCGYALFKPSRRGRTDVSEAEVLRRIASCAPPDAEALRKELERVTACLKQANESAEKFEREWYLRGDELERVKGERDAMKKALEQIASFDSWESAGPAACCARSTLTAIAAQGGDHVQG